MKLTDHPWIEKTLTGKELIFPTDKGDLAKAEVAERLGVRVGTFYERYRRARHLKLSLLNKKLFSPVKPGGAVKCGTNSVRY